MILKIAEIQSLEERLNVKITIGKGKTKQSIRIQGLRVDTTQAHVHISDIFRHVEVATVKKSQEALIAKTVQTSTNCICSSTLNWLNVYFIICSMNWLTSYKYTSEMLTR